MSSGTTCNLFPNLIDDVGMNKVMHDINCLKLDFDDTMFSKEEASTRLLAMKLLIDILGEYHSNAVDIVESDGYNRVIADGYINDTLDNAKEAKKYFFEDYEMYKSYCSQWDGNNIKVRPVPEDVYSDL